MADSPALASPFTHHAPAASASPGVDPARVEQVDKPWGHEEIVAVLEGRYVGKILHIDAGAALSLQKHLVKEETLSVLTGQITIEYGPDRNALRTVTLNPGDGLLIHATVVHRISAVQDSQVMEVSTAWPGWRTDVVRLEDRYGREGSTRA